MALVVKMHALSLNAHTFTFTFINSTRAKKCTVMVSCGCRAARLPFAATGSFSNDWWFFVRSSNVRPTWICASDLLKNLSEACKLLNVLFWCHFLSFFLSVLLFSGSPLSLVTFSIPPSQQSLIEVEPISAYAVFKQTQSTAVLFLPHLPSFSSDLLELFQHPETSANMHAYRLCNPHVRLWLRDTISHCKASHRNDALVPCRGAAVALEASHSCPLHVTATCRVCLNECLLFQ